MLTDFDSRLRQSNLSSNTIESYSKAVRQYFSLYDTVTKHNLLSFKGYLIEKYKPKTVNLRLQAINRYLEYLKKDHLKLKFVKVQQQNFLENVISDADYRFFTVINYNNKFQRTYFSKILKSWKCCVSIVMYHNGGGINEP